MSLTNPARLQALMRLAALTDWAIASAATPPLRENVVAYARTKAKSPGWQTCAAITRGFNAAFRAKHGVDPALTETDIFGDGPLPPLPGLPSEGAAA